jgi:hypothetical protein
MKSQTSKIILAVIIIAIIVGVGIYYRKSFKQQEPVIVTPELVAQSNMELEPAITEKDESEKAKNALITFFDYLNENEFEKASGLFSSDETDWESIKVYSPEDEASNKAKILENYCEAVGTCLKAKILEAKQTANYEYNLVVQFLNKDGSIYIFGPCCGATEEEMPSKDKFDYTVKKIDNAFEVKTPPLYRP